MIERSLVHNRRLSHNRVIRTGFRLIRFTTALLLLVASFPDAGLALSPGGRQVRDLICNKSIRFDSSISRWRLKLAKHAFYEDGAAALIRTGYEVALFSRLKSRLYYKAEPLAPAQVFLETIDVMIDVRRARQSTGVVELNLMDVLLTALNVTRLLARPEQWFREDHDPSGRKRYITSAGQNRVTDDEAFPIILDLKGFQSVDTLPTTNEFAVKGARFLGHSYIYEAFYGQDGVFWFFDKDVLQPRAIEERNRKGWSAAHWNGGIHYYYFTGALAWLVGGQGAANDASNLERFIKWSMGDPVRSEVQRSVGFYNGVAFIKRFYDGLNELSADDMGCLDPPTKPDYSTPKAQESKEEEMKREIGFKCNSDPRESVRCLCNWLLENETENWWMTPTQLMNLSSDALRSLARISGCNSPKN